MTHRPWLLALVLAACLTTAPARDAALAPARIVYASSEMSPDCIGSVVSAVEQLRGRGVDLVLVFAPLEHRVFWLEPAPGEVSVRSDFDEHTHSAPVVTYSWLTPDNRVERAEIVFQVCMPMLALRELTLAINQVPSEARRDPIERPLGDPH